METYTFVSDNLFRRVVFSSVLVVFELDDDVQMSDNNFEKSDPDKKENKVRGLYTIYNMDSIAQMSNNNFKKAAPDKKENKVRGLYTIYNMDSIAQMSNNNFKKAAPDKKKKIRLEDCILYIIWTR